MYVSKNSIVGCLENRQLIGVKKHIFSEHTVDEKIDR